MGNIAFTVKVAEDISAPFSSSELKGLFLSAIPLSKNGNVISDDTINFYISSAVSWLESYLGIKLSRQIITETKDWISDDWINWGFIKTTYPVQAPVGLVGYLGVLPSITYPIEWMSCRQTSDNKTFSREFRLVPNTGSLTINDNAFLGIYTSPLISWWRENRQIPNYWNVSYITGFVNDKVPDDILQAIGMIACIPILGLASDLFLGTSGLGFGASSKSISIDGLSQSVSSFANGQTGVFGARIKQYADQLYGANGKPGLLEILKDSYSAIIFGVC